MRDGMAYEGVVKWVRPPEYGIAFLAAHALNDLTNPELQYLRKLSLACGPR